MSSSTSSCPAEGWKVVLIPASPQRRPVGGRKGERCWSMMSVGAGLSLIAWGRLRANPRGARSRAPRRDIPAFLFEFSTLRAFSRSGRGQDADQRAEPSTSAVLPSRHPGSRGPARSGGVEPGPNRSARTITHTHRTAVPCSHPASRPEPPSALLPVDQESPHPSRSTSHRASAR